MKSAETIPADAILEDAIAFIEGLAVVPLLTTDDIEMRLGDVQTHARIEAASLRKRLSDRSTRPAEPAALTVDTIAAFLHKEVEWPEDNYPAYAWPEVDGDTGQRDGGYVKIVPKYVVEEFRGIARRLLIAFRQEGVVPTEPAARVAEVKAWLLGDPATGQWIEVDGHRVEYSRGMGTPAHVLASAFQAERARADAAEQRAAAALARAEKAEHRSAQPIIDGLSLANAKALVELFGGDETDMTVEFIPEGHSGSGFYAWCTEYPEDGSDFLGPASEFSYRASREAQPATDGGEA